MWGPGGIMIGKITLTSHAALQIINALILVTNEE
jgi:hypothetical protein